MDRLIDFLMYALPGGFIGSVFTWFVGRRKQSNDMLSQLQASINLLSDENRKILQENVQLRRENAGLKANQEEMLIKLARLTKEVERLRKVINKQTGNEEKTNSKDNFRHVGGSFFDGVCTCQENYERAIEHPDTAKRNHRGTIRPETRTSGKDDGGTLPTTDDNQGDPGGNSGFGSDGGSADTEPP